MELSIFEDPSSVPPQTQGTDSTDVDAENLLDVLHESASVEEYVDQDPPAQELRRSTRRHTTRVECCPTSHGRHEYDLSSRGGCRFTKVSSGAIALTWPQHIKICRHKC